MGFFDIFADAARSYSEVKTFQLNKKGCEDAGGNIVMSLGAKKCEVKQPDGSVKYLYPVRVEYGELQNGGKRRTKRQKKIKKINKSKKQKKIKYNKSIKNYNRK